MDTIEGHMEAGLVRLIREVIENEFADAPRISASMVADVVYKRRFEPENPAPIQERDAALLTLRKVAARVLKEMFQPDQDAETALRHADALERWGESRGLLKKGE